MYSRFNKRGLKCAICGRTFNEHSSDHVCPECFEIAGIDNEVNDHGPEAFTAATALQLAGYLAAIAKKGGDVEAAKASNDYIDWTLVPTIAARASSKKGGDTRATNGVAAQVTVEFLGKTSSYLSVAQAFKHIGLPIKQHQKFRIQLKAAGRATFSHLGNEFHFTAAGF